MIRLFAFRSGLFQTRVQIGKRGHEWCSQITSKEKALLCAGAYLAERYSVFAGDLEDVELVKADS